MAQTENMTHANCASVVIANINKPSEKGVNAKRTLSFWQNVFQKRLLCFWVDRWPNCTQKVVIECLKPVGDYSLFSKGKH